MNKRFTVFDGPSNVWERAWESLARSTCAFDMVREDPAMAPLGAQVRSAFIEWSAVESERVQLRANLASISSRGRVADAALDYRVARLATAVIEKHGGRDGEIYRAMFPLAHESVIALGLDAELPAVALALSCLEKYREQAPELLEHVAPLRTAMQAGTSALADRAEVYGALGRLQARIESWLESESSLEIHVRSALTELAAQRGMDARWIEAFAV
ncbi:MAG: hypothetical protein Q8Q09_25005 [Deltaproteobacteria bacterium]|nr:hypothetical protein [Deltaproteobacteria bacterium]